MHFSVVLHMACRELCLLLEKRAMRDAEEKRGASNAPVAMEKRGSGKGSKSTTLARPHDLSLVDRHCRHE